MSDPVSNLFHSFSNMSQPMRMEEQSDVTLFIPVRNRLPQSCSMRTAKAIQIAKVIYMLIWLYFFLLNTFICVFCKTSCQKIFLFSLDKYYK